MYFFYEEKVEKKNKKLKILIVENDVSAALLQTELVKEHCSDIYHAVTGLEAVQACRCKPDIDLVLMDMHMPEMNGREASRQIRQFNKDIVIIAQTAYLLTGGREKALEAGCNDYVSKPFNQAGMSEIIHKHFKKSQ